MIEGKFLRSPYAHARIRSIDTAEAEAMPGVVAVLTSKDLNDIGPYIGRGKNKDQPVIALNRVIFAGQPVAAVAALDRATAEEALTKIHVDYEELPAVISVEDAMADGAPRLHDFAERNLCAHHELVKGDVEKGFAEADLIVEDEFDFPDDLSLLDGAAHRDRPGRRRRHYDLDLHQPSVRRAPGCRRCVSRAAIESPRSRELRRRRLRQQIGR